MTVEEWLGENNKLGIDVWYKKYQQNKETFEQWLDRVSGGNPGIRQMIVEKKFLFGGRILAGRGIKDQDGRKMSLSNCYVIPHPEDNLESIFDCIKNMARTYSYGGGCGTDLSALSPKGARIRNAAKTTSGAVSWMDLFSTTTASVCQDGRRGALMLTLDCNHPDIEEFIDAKMDLDKITKANISVKFNNDFFTTVENEGELTTIFKREATGEIITKKINPKQLLHKMAHNNWTMGEPGALFWDRIKEWNLNSNNPEYNIVSTNPCGEQPLLDGGSCLLGSINLAEFVKEDKSFDFIDFIYCVKKAIDGLNEVLDEGIELHPLKVQQDIAKEWRNCGLGIMGLADMLIKMGITYGSQDSIDLCRDIAHDMIYAALDESANLAEKFGAFPKCNNNLIIRSDFFKYVNVSDLLKQKIEKYGLRNCALLTIAPTGSLSNLIGVSGGIEPIFANSYTRKTESLNGDNKEPVYYKVYTPIVEQFMKENNIQREEELPSYFITSHQIDPMQRIDMQAVWQKYIDASISSTINLKEDVDEDTIYNLYLYGWAQGLKGMTVYRNNCARTGILTTDDNKNKKTIKIIKEYKRGDVLPVSNHLVGLKRKLITGCGSLHCLAYFDPDTKELQEVYLSKGSSGGCNNFMIGSSRLISLCARAGVSLNDIID